MNLTFLKVDIPIRIATSAKEEQETNFQDSDSYKQIPTNTVINDTNESFTHQHHTHCCSKYTSKWVCYTD